jgi:hypothetical protein
MFLCKPAAPSSILMHFDTFMNHVQSAVMIFRFCLALICYQLVMLFLGCIAVAKHFLIRIIFLHGAV